MIKAITVTTAILMMGKVLGFIREAFIAGYFGASKLTDMYFVAAVIPELMFTAVGLAMSSGLMPSYMEEKGKNKWRANEMMSVVATFFFMTSIAITLVSYLFIPVMTHVIAPGFSADQMKMTRLLIAIMIPGFCFYVLSGVARGVLQAHKKFATSAAVVIPHNLMIILFIVFTTAKYGIIGLTIGTVVGISSQFFIQCPQLLRLDIHFNFSIRKYWGHIRSILHTIYPIMIASVAFQMNQVVDRMVASLLQHGSVSALNYANRLMYLPLSIIIMSLITVFYPRVIEAAKENQQAYLRFVHQGMKRIVFVCIPIVALMIVERRELVSVAFMRGAFHERALDMTVFAFFFYSFALVFIALKDFLMKSLIAVHDTKTPMVTSLIAVGLNVGLSFWLASFLAQGGIALATGIAMMVQTVMMLVVIHQRAQVKARWYGSVVRYGGLFLVVLAVSFALKPMLSSFSDLAAIICMTGLVFMLFFVFSLCMKVEEIKTARQILGGLK